MDKPKKVIANFRRKTEYSREEIHAINESYYDMYARIKKTYSPHMIEETNLHLLYQTYTKAHKKLIKARKEGKLTPDIQAKFHIKACYYFLAKLMYHIKHFHNFMEEGKLIDPEGSRLLNKVLDELEACDKIEDELNEYLAHHAEHLE